jgi:NADH:ubiquinone oxidoreductase subunit 2 (subunit N)
MLPIITSTISNQETEAAIKYFFPQAIGSACFLLSIIPLFSPQILAPLSHHLSPILFLFRILIKIGAAPCHFWLPNVIARIG